MKNEIIGNTYEYIIDTSYGINKDGFIAIGSESIVYKGLKTRIDGGLQFSCVLKFKPKYILIDGKIVNRLEIFKNEEWKIFEELRECRSIVRIDDVVDDLGDFSLPCNKVASGVINSESYFCVVEEFIDGWSLEEFCREEYWKLRRIEPLGNGLSNIINYHDFSDDEKSAINLSYNYDNILKYQDQIMLFMINLCEIMEFVTEQKNILHLDIKPENIMVTRYGKELVLIDFGKSKK
ncbi:protein kinase domain-containing protein [Acetivibrio clariflavus]|uniref:protein kinase domain-containing protein n=1 Tax=Acetivibrio clariflavus TaxID=288965 RepID=UPI0003187DF8|nr:protein kinase [Acetivibrio clariflavus]